MKPSSSELFFVGSFLIIDSISLAVTNLFRFSVSTWFSLGRYVCFYEFSHFFQVVQYFGIWQYFLTILCITVLSLFFSFLIFFLNPQMRRCLLILEKKEGREKEKNISVKREKSIGCLLYAPRPEIDPRTFWCTEQHSKQLSHLAGPFLILFT